MNKNTIVSIIIFLLLLGLAISPITFSKKLSTNIIDDNPRITPEDEGDHFPCAYEIWFYHAILKFENGQEWDTAATFVYFMDKTKDGYINGNSFIRNRLWNKETDECFDYFQSDVFPGEFNTKKNEINLTYYNSTGRGIYPNYHFYIHDDVNNIKLDLNFHATSFSCWLAQESMDRIIPCGLGGSLKAYFIPIIEIEGIVTINKTTYNVTGIGYFEHDFADTYFGNPFAFDSIKELLVNLRSIFLYTKWYWTQVFFNRPGVNPSRHRSNDYLLGWVWNWNVFENGYSIVIFRPAMMCKSGGILPLFMYLSKDGKNFTEFGYVHWTNIREIYIERADVYLPIEYEIFARKDGTELFMNYNTTTSITELYRTDWVPGAKGESCTFYCCGNVTGYCKDEDGEVQFNGCGAVEQTRSLPKRIKHHSRDVEFLLPPDGLGISIRVRSHWFGFERFLRIQIKPHFEIEFYFKRIPRSK